MNYIDSLLIQHINLTDNERIKKSIQDDNVRSEHVLNPSPWEAKFESQMLLHDETSGRWINLSWSQVFCFNI